MAGWSGDGWSAPWRLPDDINSGSSTFAPAITRDGSLFFMRPDPATQQAPAGAAGVRSDG
jgi:hypothetical protein